MADMLFEVQDTFDGNMGGGLGDDVTVDNTVFDVVANSGVGVLKFVNAPSLGTLAVQRTPAPSVSQVTTFLPGTNDAPGFRPQAWTTPVTAQAWFKINDQSDNGAPAGPLFWMPAFNLANIDDPDALAEDQFDWSHVEFIYTALTSTVGPDDYQPGITVLQRPVGWTGDPFDYIETHTAIPNNEYLRYRIVYYPDGSSQVGIYETTSDESVIFTTGVVPGPPGWTAAQVDARLRNHEGLVQTLEWWHVWIPAAAMADYRRNFPRDDGLAGGARRNYPPSKAIQSGNRTSGGYI